MCKSILLYFHIFSLSMIINSNFVFIFFSIFFATKLFLYPVRIRYSHVCSWGKLESNMSAKLWISLGMNQYVILLILQEKVTSFSGLYHFSRLEIERNQKLTTVPKNEIL